MLTNPAALSPENVYMIDHNHASFLADDGIHRLQNRMNLQDVALLWVFLSVMFIPVGFVLFFAYAVVFTIVLEMSGWEMVSIILCMLVIFGGALTVALNRLRSERQLEREGIITPGTVKFSEITSTFTPKGWRSVVVITYDYEHPIEKTTHEGKQYISVKELPADKLPQQGAKVAVLYASPKLHRVL